MEEVYFAVNKFGKKVVNKILKFDFFAISAIKERFEMEAKMYTLDKLLI